MYPKLGYNTSMVKKAVKKSGGKKRMDKRYFEVKAYLNPDTDSVLINKLLKLAKVNGLSMSTLCGLLLRGGIERLENNLLDLQLESEMSEREK